MTSATFPEDDYTPFGYLDNPYHSWKLNRSGVIRSHPPVGVGWIYPSLRTRLYSASLNVGFALSGKAYLLPEDFQQAGLALTSRYHSKNILSFHWAFGAVTFQARFYQGSEDSLLCNLLVENQDDRPKELRLVAAVFFEVDLLANTGLWSFGLNARWDGGHDTLLLQTWAEGLTLALHARQRSDGYYLFRSMEEVRSWLRHGGQQLSAAFLSNREGFLGGALRYPAALGPRERAEMLFCLSRGGSERDVTERGAADLKSSKALFDAKRRADDAFWRRCPRLVGDWPAHWRHGWVYDWETLRMNVRPPMGIYTTPWDAMQIQFPRVVLAETALDMLMMSYADENLAKRVILGTFADALGPQVPCSREDGSVNMVAEDGSQCGTSPAWCFPFYCLQSIFARTGDVEWLRQLLPHLTAYVEWWLTHRRDDQGWLFNKCSWESGQDSSKKFLIEQPTGGELTEHLRPVDLQTAMAHAAQVLAHFAEVLGQEATRWRQLHAEFTTKTQALWQGNWFCDYDRRSQNWVRSEDYWDITNLAPLMVGVARPEQLDVLKARVRGFKENPKLWLEWPSFFLMYIEALHNVGWHELASEVLGATAERVYQSWDRRDWKAGEAMPGVALEYWALEKPDGTEGYGWGATLPLHLIRSLIGFREAELRGEAFLLVPSLPREWLTEGAHYGIANLRHRGITLEITYHVSDHALLRAELRFESPSPITLRITDRQGDNVLLEGATPSRSFSVEVELQNWKPVLVEYSTEGATL